MKRVVSSPLNLDSDPSPNSLPVGLRSHKLDHNEMMVASRVNEECIVVGVAQVESPQLIVNVLITVVIKIGEGDSVPFLEMTEAAGDGDVLEP